MDREAINKVEVLDTGELLLGIESPGKPIYQYIYRAGAGVQWDQGKNGFKSSAMKEWSCSKWFKQIVEAVRSELGVALTLSANVVWLNVTEQQKAEIQSENAN